MTIRNFTCPKVTFSRSCLQGKINFMTVNANLVQELKKIYTLKALQENMKTPPTWFR